MVLLSVVSVASAQEPRVNFQFAPQHSFTTICLPADWLKSVVTSDGALGYDFGPGPYARPLTEVSVRIQGESLTVKHQTLDDARVPLVTTVLSGDNVASTQQAFAIVQLRQLPIPDPVTVGRVTRIDGITGCANWASPVGSVDPAFRNVAWGTNRPIKYLVKVEKGSRKHVALGLCESYKGSTGARILELRVEGSPPVTFDPMKDGEKNRPYVVLFEARDADEDGYIRVEAHASPRSPDPNVILNAIWVFPENVSVTPESIISGVLSSSAEVYYSCGTESEVVAPQIRADAIIASFSGKAVTPIVVVRTNRKLTYDEKRRTLMDGSSPSLFARPLPVRALMQGHQTLLEFPRGTERVEVVVLHGRQGVVSAFADLPNEVVRAKHFWQSIVGIPHAAIVVPDSGIQYLLEANIRNIYQVAERVEGQFQFQPGPSVYRGLWIGDAMLTGIPVAMLGDTATVKHFLEGAHRYQSAEGQVRSIFPLESLGETPMVVFSILWFARATGDSAWLRQMWPVVSKGLHWVIQARSRTLGNPSSAYYGLMPPGFIDGGISTPAADYGTLLWAMVCLERGSASARWLGKNDEAGQWQRVLDELLIAFKYAARRDLHRDARGNVFLPVMVGDTATALPQQGQFAFLLPLRYGAFFTQMDPLIDSVVNGNLAMLDSSSREGLIVSSGWVRDGVWPWLGGIHGIAHNLRGHAQRAVELLYAYANHASPAGTWMEEQQLRSVGSRTGGDGSDAEASAVFVHLVRSLIVMERAADLELLPALPLHWLAPGAHIEINGGLTEFGPLTLKLGVSNDGTHGSLEVSPVDGRGSNGKIRVDLRALKEVGFLGAEQQPLPDLLDWEWGREHRVEFRR